VVMEGGYGVDPIENAKVWPKLDMASSCCPSVNIDSNTCHVILRGANVAWCHHYTKNMVYVLFDALLSLTRTDDLFSTGCQRDQIRDQEV